MFWIGLMCFFVLFLMGGVVRMWRLRVPQGSIADGFFMGLFGVVFFAGVGFCAAGIVQAAMVFLR